MDTSALSTRPRRQVVSEACAWFIEFRTGEASASTRDRFDEWLRHSPEHIQAYLEVAAGWAELPTSDPQGRIDIPARIERGRSTRDDDVVVPLSSTGAHRSAVNTSGSPKTVGRRVPGYRALAASVALLTMIAGIAGWLMSYVGETYATDTGEQRTIRLSDNSVVDLNARSRIRVRFSKTTRTIELIEGQALFHVTKDRQRPFIVRSDSMAVRAVGTQFDVYRKGSGMVVTVVEGRVAVTPNANSPIESLRGHSPAVAEKKSTQGLMPGVVGSSPPPGGTDRAPADAATGDTVFLAAGEQLTVTPVAASSPHRADVSAATAWVQRRLVFEETPLAEVAEEFNRYSVRRLIIDDAELARQPISGIYSSSDPASLIGFLRAQPGLEVVETDREIRVLRRNAPSGH